MLPSRSAVSASTRSPRSSVPHGSTGSTTRITSIARIRIAFAGRLLARAGTGAVWFVSSPGYLPFADKCERVLSDLSAARGSGQTLVVADAGIFEHMGVVRFDP